MRKEVISDRQGITLIIMFIIGTSTIIVTGLDAKQDLWLANILSICIAVPMVLIYSRIHYIYPGKDLYDIFQICFGKFVGKIFCILYAWFSIHLGSLVLRDFSEFGVLTSLPNTPIAIPMIFCGLLMVWFLKEGIEVLGRWSEFFLPIIIYIILLTVLLLIPKMDINNIRPVLTDGIKPVFKGAFSALSFPFAETVIFTMVFSTWKSKKSPYSVYIWGLLIAGVIIVITSLTNILVLGLNHLNAEYFPSYTTASRLRIGITIENLEALVAFEFLIGGFIKMTICLLAACIGISKVFGLKDYRLFVTPLVLLLINLSYLLYDSTMAFLGWSFKIWPYYAFPFQIVFPILVLIVAEIRKKNVKSPGKT